MFVNPFPKTGRQGSRKEPEVYDEPHLLCIGSHGFHCWMWESHYQNGVRINALGECLPAAAH